MILRVLKTLTGFQVHHADPEWSIYSKGATIFCANADGEVASRIRLSCLPLAANSLYSTSLGPRLLRRGVHSVRRSRYDDNSIFVQIDGSLKLVGLSSPHSQIDLHVMPRGRRVLRRGWCEAGMQRILIGEYFGNADRDSVFVYATGRDVGSSICQTFSAGQIRHIHALEFDPYTQKVWVATGDDNSECLIGQMDAEGRLENVIGRGTQEWRTVSLAFYPDAVYWGTDNHAGGNQIWRYDRSNSTVESMGAVTGPVYYNVCLPDHVVFSTAMEKGEGDQDGYSRIYALDIERGDLTEVRRERKDRRSAKWFGYGVFEFAEGSMRDNRFWVTAKGLEGGLRSELLELVI